ncbi:MAG: hypothetical protein ABSE62_15770 [Chthoniobacteraceae bacterium]
MAEQDADGAEAGDVLWGIATEEEGGDGEADEAEDGSEGIGARDAGIEFDHAHGGRGTHGRLRAPGVGIGDGSVHGMPRMIGRLKAGHG